MGNKIKRKKESGNNKGNVTLEGGDHIEWISIWKSRVGEAVISYHRFHDTSKF